MGRNSGGGGCGICRLINIVLTLGMLGAGGYMLWHYLGRPSAQQIRDTLGNIDFGDFTDVLDNFTGFDPGFFNEDPYVGDNSTQLWKGHTDGEGGLTLELRNALDTNWYTEFDEAVNDWNTYCNPKVLDLSTSIISVDHTCEHIEGVMKVCNGNYGDTGWLGINEVMKTVPQAIIVSSAAKMNEYYLNNAGYEERLYTMCHEIGHGFGLPHTDENFNNQDLGNCLDYTNRPENNLRPGVVNCNRLLENYGSIGGRRRRSLVRKNEQQSHYRTNSKKQNGDGPVQRYLGKKSDEYDHALDELTNHIMKERSLMASEKNSDCDFDHENNIISESTGWRRLVDNDDTESAVDHRGATYQRHLSDDLLLEVHVLFPTDRHLNKNPQAQQP